jgi:hypothetical protein
MKYAHTTKGLAALGRHGDDTLLHINQNEIAGLEALAGRPLTVNPETGLPEAFSLTDILAPVALGVLGAFTGGAAEVLGAGTLGSTLAGAGASGLAGGALSAAQHKGFMPGFVGGAIAGGAGGFGASGTTGMANAEGLGSLGRDVVSPTKLEIPQAGTGSLYEAGTAGRTAAIPGLTTSDPTQVGAAAWQSAGNAQLPGSVGSEVGRNISGGLGNINKVGTVGLENPIVESKLPAVEPDYFGQIGQGLGNMMTKGNLETIGKYALPGMFLGSTAAAGLEQSEQSDKERKQAQQLDALKNLQTQNYFANMGFPMSPLSSIPQTLNYAAGGPVEFQSSVGNVPLRGELPAKYASVYEQAGLGNLINRPEGMANGGYINTTPFKAQEFHPQSRITSAQPYAGAAPNSVINTLSEGASFADGGSVYEDGGLLDGPGDGMSDDIPANIDGEEDIRLADGEFVIPPEIVAMVGKGDREKGSKVFDAILKAVRTAAHGKPEQIKQDKGSLAAQKMIERAMRAKSA